MAKTISATQKFIRMSPSKLRVLANLVKPLKAQEAVETLPFIGKRAAEPFGKVLKSAIANAKEVGLNPDNLVFDEIQIMEGPRLKRFRPVSRGRAHSIVKKMSHIKISLKEKEEPIKAEKPEPTKQEMTKEK